MSHDASPARVLTPTVEAALAVAADEAAKRERLWRMTRDQRRAAFYRGELTLGDCLAWARRHPNEPPLAADGEYLFIAVRTPEWADEPTRTPTRRPAAGRDL